jgi:diaminopimelate epimerase
MVLEFHKYHGTGNDFILVDDRSSVFYPDQTLIARLCDRRFGIGSDGLLILRNKAGFDFEMVYYNSDGSPATFCGNGSRCIVAFASHLGIGNNEFHFIAADGLHKASVTIISENEDWVKVNMIDPLIYSHNDEFTYLNTGTFHVVKFVENPDSVEIMEDAPGIRYDKQFEPAGTNVNYAAFRGEEIYVRTYEKGVEAETLSCGTGVTATAIAASLLKGMTNLNIRTKGGSLKVHFDKDGDRFYNVQLEGPAVKVFSGIINL